MECRVRESSQADRRNLFKPTGAIFSSRQAQSFQADRHIADLEEGETNNLYPAHRVSSIQ